MNIDFTPEELEFQQEVRTWFAQNLPADLKEKNRLGAPLSKNDIVDWQKKLNQKGWLAITWPQEYGGPEWSPTQRYIFDMERARAGAPVGISMGIVMLGPVLQAFGTQEQKDRYLPRILSCEDWWCQGYSEPGAGSDLAGLKTEMVADGNEYLINGSKIWTTYAHYANWCFCLVRTNKDVKKQAGISFVLIAMDTPGITVRPIVSIDGEHHLNEVFFDDVRIPKENLVGQEGQGWTIAKYLLTHERTTIAGVADSKVTLEGIKQMALKTKAGDQALAQQESLDLKIAETEIDLLALEYTNFRTLAATAAGQGPGAESSILKINGTEIQQTLSELMVDLAGYHAAPFSTEMGMGPPEFQHSLARYNFLRAATIYGGSHEIQKNVITKMILGLS